jgi:hypothetical protein
MQAHHYDLVLTIGPARNGSQHDGSDELSWTYAQLGKDNTLCTQEMT